MKDNTERSPPRREGLLLGSDTPKRKVGKPLGSITKPESHLPDGSYNKYPLRDAEYHKKI
jgi:hypothetical protein